MSMRMTLRKMEIILLLYSYAAGLSVASRGVTPMHCLAIVAMTAMLLAPFTVARGGPAACTVLEGAGIAGVRLGMRVAAALVSSGSPVRHENHGAETIYVLRPPLDRMAIVAG